MNENNNFSDKNVNSFLNFFNKTPNIAPEISVYTSGTHSKLKKIDISTDVKVPKIEGMDNIIHINTKTDSNQSLSYLG